MRDDDIEIVPRQDHLEVVFKGEFTRAAARRVVDVMVESSRKVGLPLVLLDCRTMTGQMSIFDRFVLAEYGARRIDRNIVVAVVGRDGDILPDRFFENAAVSRGVRVRSFTDPDEATKWLRGRGPTAMS